MRAQVQGVLDKLEILRVARDELAVREEVPTPWLPDTVVADIEPLEYGGEGYGAWGPVGPLPRSTVFTSPQQGLDGPTAVC